MSNLRCISCKESDLLTLSTYKRLWHCCKSCGTAVSEERTKYPLRFLSFPDLKHNSDLDEEKMYDYFIEPVHIEWSEKEGKEFIEEYLVPNEVDVTGLSVLDISGGNGHFLRQIQGLGANVALTEINKKTIDYARRVHGFDVFEFNLNEDDLFSVCKQKFDIILARACIMFALDLSEFVRQIKSCLSPGGLLIINNSVKPTLGVMVRVQLDEFSYLVLRRPEIIIENFARHGFTVERRFDETDQSLYVYDDDLLPHRMAVHYLYEIRGARRLMKDRLFELPARDRRRSTLFLRSPEVGMRA